MRLPPLLIIACAAGIVAALSALMHGYGFGAAIAAYVMVGQAVVFLGAAVTAVIFWNE